MSPWRYFRLEGARDGAAWPSDRNYIQPGEVTRRRDLPDPQKAVFNEETKDWVWPIWVEVDDPRLALSTSSGSDS